MVLSHVQYLARFNNSNLWPHILSGNSYGSKTGPFDTMNLFLDLANMEVSLVISSRLAHPNEPIDKKDEFARFISELIRNFKLVWHNAQNIFHSHPIFR